MRRLDQRAQDDAGGATIFVILALTAMLLGGGFAIDVGQYVVEARSAQNTADATVLAVATDCAIGASPIADYSPYRHPGQTITPPACGSGVATITVTKDVGGLLLRQTAGSVSRTAEARWGTLGRARTAPIVISDCELSEARLDGDIDVVFYLDDTKPQSGCSSLPGGFSQLETDGLDSVGCPTVEVIAGTTADGKPGADLQKIVPCLTAPVGPALPFDILIPVYDAAACAAADCTGKGPYPILGFAAIRGTGYSLNGNNFAGTLGKKCPDTTRGRYCLQGDFIRFTTTIGTTGGGGDYGVTQVSLSK